MERGGFRQDLYYRINVLNVSVPPLRERREDIPTLIDHFLSFYSLSFNLPAPPISSHVMQLFTRYEWPGNIRELENLIKRYVILGSEEAITADLTAPSHGGLSPKIQLEEGVSLKEITRRAVQELERKIILQVLQANHWNRKQAARKLRISYRALLYKIHQAGLPSRSNRPLPEPRDEKSKANE